MTAKSFRQCLRATACAAALLASAPLASAADNPLARGTWGPVSSGPIYGTWNGTDLERRSGCNSAQNDGDRGTYAEFDVSTNPTTGAMAIDQRGITTLNCTYSGSYGDAGGIRSWSGTYTCSDGKHGTFRSRSILVTQYALSIHLDIQLDTTEACAIEAVISAGRLYP